MTDFVLSARESNDPKEFGNEPGPASYLRVPGRYHPRPEQAIDRDEWIAELIAEATTGVDAETGLPTGCIVIFVHGYNNSPRIALARQRQLQAGLRAAGSQCLVVGYDWPSAEVTAGYMEDRTDAKLSALNLVSDGIALLCNAQENDCQIQVNVLAHSMGAYVVREAFDDADDRPALAAVNWMVSQLCFIGGDVSARSMAPGNPKSESLYRHSHRITNYYNPYDAILRVSNAKRAGTAPRIGRVGLPETIPDRAVNVNCGPHFATLEDVTGNYSKALAHSFYFGDPLWTRDFAYTLQGELPAGLIPTRTRQEGELILSPMES